MIDSHFQNAIYDFMAGRTDNGAMIGVAGCGKTYTAIRALEKCSPMYSVLLGAFNVDIRDTFKAKVKHLQYIRPVNYNGFGWQICMANVPRCRLDEHKTINTLKYYTGKGLDEKTFHKIAGTYKRLISLFKNRGIFTVEDAILDLKSIYDHYDIEPVDDPTLLMETFAHVIGNKIVMDFDDQKYMPLKEGWTVPIYDTVVIDEFQDTCEIEFLLMMKASSGGRFYCFGDPDQSIYGFKGSTPDAFALYCEILRAKRLPLSICYRCPRSVIREAQRFVPRILPADDAIEGNVEWGRFEAGVGDFVLCRTTEPLVERCLNGLSRKQPGKVRGREIGDKLEYMIETICNHDHSISIIDFGKLLVDYQYQQVAKMESLQQDALAQQVEDRCKSLRVICRLASSVQDLFRIVDEVFCDDKDRHVGVDYMTIHRSKGLQAKNVWLLRPDLLPHPRAKKRWMKEEENRLSYVAITRAEETFTYVDK